MIVLFGCRHAEAQDHLAEEGWFGKRVPGPRVILADPEHDLVNAGHEVCTVEQGTVAAAVRVGGCCGDPPPLAVEAIDRHGYPGTGFTLRRVQHVCRQPCHRSSFDRNSILPSLNHSVNNIYVFINIVTTAPRLAARPVLWRQETSGAGDRATGEGGPLAFALTIC